MQAHRNVLLICCAAASTGAWGQCVRGTEWEIESRPNRPTVSTSAQTTECGVLEIEYGWTLQRPEAGTRESGLGGMMRFGLLPRLDLRWSADGFLALADSVGKRSGAGDDWVGAQYYFRSPSAISPALALNYAAKIPAATDGIGSGYLDHRVTFIASKDLRGMSWNFNTAYILTGRDSGFDRSWELAAGFSRPIRGHLGMAGDFYVDTEQNPDNPAFASTLWAVTYTVRPRLVLDAAIDTGLTHWAPQRRFMVGFTYAVADMNGMLQTIHHGRR